MTWDGSPHLPEPTQPRRLTGVQRLAAILARIEYKPGWVLSARVQGSAVYLQVAHTTTDSTRHVPGPFSIVHSVPISALELEMYYDSQMLDWVHAAVRDAEHHEFQEFFWVDGKVLVNPHEGE